MNCHNADGYIGEPQGIFTTQFMESLLFFRMFSFDGSEFFTFYVFNYVKSHLQEPAQKATCFYRYALIRITNSNATLQET